MTQTTLATVKLIIEFSKRLPGFQSLCQKDQLSILKSSSSEAMMIRTARRYDPVTGNIVYSNNDTYDHSAYDDVGLKNDDLFSFCRKAAKLNVDDAEFALLTAITIFSDRDNIMEKQKVCKDRCLQRKLLKLLLNHAWFSCLQSKTLICVVGGANPDALCQHLEDICEPSQR